MLGNRPLPLQPLQGSSTIAVRTLPPVTAILGTRRVPCPSHCRHTIDKPAMVITLAVSLRDHRTQDTCP